MSFDVDAETLATIINHVFLTTQLPGGADPIHFEEKLVDLVIKALQAFLDNSSLHEKDLLRTAINALTNLKTCTPGCTIVSNSGLLSLLQKLSQGSTLIRFYHSFDISGTNIRSQNYRYDRTGFPCSSKRCPSHPNPGASGCF